MFHPTRKLQFCHVTRFPSTTKVGPWRRRREEEEQVEEEEKEEEQGGEELNRCGVLVRSLWITTIHPYEMEGYHVT